MKKFFGIFFSIVMVATFLQFIDLSVSSPSASAASPENRIDVEENYSDTKPAEPIPAPPAGCGSNCPAPVPITPPVPKSPCLTYNGSPVYPVDTTATCNGTIAKQDGSTYNFSCPPSGDVSAVYVEYSENLYREYSVFDRKDGPTWPAKYRIGGRYTFGTGQPWTVTLIKGYATNWSSDGRNEVQIRASNTPWTNFQSAINQMYSFTYTANGRQSIQAYHEVDIIPSIKCVYPVKPVPQPLYSVVCYLYYDSQFYQDANKSAILSGGSLVGEKYGIKAGQVADINNPNNYGVTIGNHLGCQTEYFSQPEKYTLAYPEDGGYGYYRLHANVFATRCYVEGYPLWTDNHSKDVITSCTQPFLYQQYNTYNIYSCRVGYIQTGRGNAGWAALPDNENFAVSACENFQCDAVGSLTIGGTSSPLQVMRNGENLPVIYPTIRVETGGSSKSKPADGATTWEEVTDAASGVLDGSSPFNTATNVNSSKQYFALRDSENKAATFLNARSGDTVTAQNSNPQTAWQPQIINGIANSNYSKGSVNFNWASAKDTKTGVSKSWNMFRSFRVHGEFLVPVTDTSGGGTSEQWQHEIKYCGNIISNSVTVVRSVNEIK